MSGGQARPRPGLRLLTWAMIGALVGVTWLALNRRPLTNGGAKTTLPTLRIDVNRASVDELQVLPSIGPALAERIVADRETNGPFVSLEDLGRVSHIGPGVIERIRPYATAGDPNTAGGGEPEKPASPDE